MIIAIPTDITEVEKRAFYDLIANSAAKANTIYMVEKPIADALGAGLDITNARGVMTVDIGVIHRDLHYVIRRHCVKQIDSGRW